MFIALLNFKATEKLLSFGNIELLETSEFLKSRVS